jgi:translation initiation factor 5A
VTTTKTGKHGHAKAHITCVDIFTGKKYEVNEPTSHNLFKPRVEKFEYDLVDLDSDGKVTYANTDGTYDESLTMDTES